MVGSTALEYFSSTYSQAREKFLGAVGASNAEIASYENPHLGSEGKQIFTDVALLGLESAPSVLVLCSGSVDRQYRNQRPIDPAQAAIARYPSGATRLLALTIRPDGGLQINVKSSGRIGPLPVVRAVCARDR